MASPPLANRAGRQEHQRNQKKAKRAARKEADRKAVSRSVTQANKLGLSPDGPALQQLQTALKNAKTPDHRKVAQYEFLQNAELEYEAKLAAERAKTDKKSERLLGMLEKNDSKSERVLGMLEESNGFVRTLLTDTQEESRRTEQREARMTATIERKAKQAIQVDKAKRRINRSAMKSAKRNLALSTPGSSPALANIVPSTVESPLRKSLLHGHCLS